MLIDQLVVSSSIPFLQYSPSLTHDVATIRSEETGSKEQEEDSVMIHRTINYL